MPENPIKSPLPADLPENWVNTQTIAAAGSDVGLSEKHGYNYLMGQVNATQRAANAIGTAFAGLNPAALGAVPDTRKVNGKALNADISLSPNDVGVTAKRTCLFVIGTSTAGWTEADCDFLCDGVDDQIEINQALAAENKFGGLQEIVLLPGEYNLSGQLSSLEGIVLVGGSNAIDYYNKVWLRLSSGTNLIVGGDVTLKNLYLANEGQIVSSGDISSCFFENCSAKFTGTFSDSCFIRCGNLYQSYLSLSNSTNTTIQQCSFDSVSLSGCSNISIIGCYAGQNSEPASLSLSNTDNSVIVGNDFNRAWIMGSHENLLAGNIFSILQSNAIGDSYALYAIDSNKNLLVGNKVFMGEEVDMSTTYSLYFDFCSQTLVADNFIFGKNYYVNGGTDNTFVNNKYN